jgi:nucleoside-diphosphate-sugar epimerase
MIFVTGGTGLLGAHLLYDLTKENKRVRAMYRRENRIDNVKFIFKFYNTENWEKQFKLIEWVQGDILDITTLEELIQGCKQVYHSAALVSFHPKDFNALLKINREGTENIVNVCLTNNVEKLCYVSSTAAIGGEDNKIISENTKWKKTPTTSSYSISKYSAEREVWRGIEEGLDAVIVNPCVILGPGNWEESSLTIFKTVQKGLKFHPPGSNATVDVRDVSNVMTQLMESDISGERYLVIGSNQSFKELMTEIANQLNVKPPSKQVSKGVVTFARILSSIFNGIIGKRSTITKDTVSSLYSSKSYDNTKIKEVIGITFRPLSEQVENAIKGRIN